MKKLLLSALMFASISSFAQTKKVILHDYTGVNCQYCTDGTVRIEAMQATNPTDFIPIQIHTGSYTPSTSPMKTSVGDEILTLVTPPGYPCGSVDMLKYDPSGSTGLAMSRSYWGNAFSAQKAKGAIASISIDNRVDKGGGTYECDVVVEFTSAPSSTSPIN
ncbi:MAG: hypothetical protein KDC11_11065, partial [Chitinophagaceae bacterium]|nr:hypothetical protein [Chitinophagaceae bacterium]